MDLGNLYKKKIGFKAIVYNFDNNTKVKLESFVDVKNEAKRILCKIIWKNWWWEMGINNGKAKMNDCGAINKTSTISWGSPMIILITNNLNFDL
jgi:hypothetical protein